MSPLKAFLITLLSALPAFTLPQSPPPKQQIYTIHLSQRPCDEPTVSPPFTGCLNTPGYLPTPSPLEYINNTLMSISHPSPKPLQFSISHHPDENYVSLFALDESSGNIDERELGLSGDPTSPFGSLMLARDRNRQPFSTGRFSVDGEGRISWEGAREWISLHTWRIDDLGGKGYWPVTRYSDRKFSSPFYFVRRRG
jgi:hypothetical protein